MGNLSALLAKQFCPLGQLLGFLILGFGVLGLGGTLAVAVVVPSCSRVRHPIPFSKSVLLGFAISLAIASLCLLLASTAGFRAAEISAAVLRVIVSNKALR